MITKTIRPGILALNDINMDWLQDEISKGIPLPNESEDFDDFDEETVLLGGWKETPDGKYEADELKEYSAYLDYALGYPLVTVIHSRNVINTLSASRCCMYKSPGSSVMAPMGNLDEVHEDGEPTFGLPKEAMASEDN